MLKPITDKIYYAKFRDTCKEFTGHSTFEEHKRNIDFYGKCIWGKWCGDKIHMTDDKLTSIANNVPFNLYFADGSNQVLLHSHVINVLTKEQVIEKGLTYLIPSYYGIERRCMCYFIIDSLESINYEECKNIVSVAALNRNEYMTLFDDCGQNPWVCEGIILESYPKYSINEIVKVKDADNFKVGYVVNINYNYSANNAFTYILSDTCGDKTFGFSVNEDDIVCNLR